MYGGELSKRDYKKILKKHSASTKLVKPVKSLQVSKKK